MRRVVVNIQIMVMASDGDKFGLRFWFGLGLILGVRLELGPRSS